MTPVIDSLHELWTVLEAIRKITRSPKAKEHIDRGERAVVAIKETVGIN